ncbi:TIM barrel protein [Ruania alkalisoli]|uniref:TIM barrel protein n=1 Tax=Ruania alkalisoli TaxID=2779775 RepID=A0A7M1SRK2_9MICO|nr:TIM barrel protein [Ruania alkalisoli]QOR69412.1 TIM barrel protein [Ruania alkalisoli]
MQFNDYDVSANVSLLFTEVHYLDRFQAAADAGFRTVESWWPFTEPHPGNDRVDEVAARIADAGVQLIGLNFYAGDMPGGERGVTCRPERADELDRSTEALLRLARATGVQKFNLLYGQPDTGEEQAQRAHAVGAYRRAAEAVAEIDGTILVEPLARGLNGSYPLHDDHDVAALIDEVGSPRLAQLFDSFHLGMNGVDVAEVARQRAGATGHVQLADSPGRGEPGSGDLDFTAIAAALREGGYRGTVAAEYKPTRATTDTLDWLTPSAGR